MVVGIVMAALVLVVGGMWTYQVRTRRLTRHVYRCPCCAQQIRYAASQAGSAGHCPRCWKKIAIPHRPEPALVGTRTTAQIRMEGLGRRARLRNYVAEPDPRGQDVAISHHTRRRFG